MEKIRTRVAQSTFRHTKCELDKARVSFESNAHVTNIWLFFSRSVFKENGTPKGKMINFKNVQKTLFYIFPYRFVYIN